ncbi:MAG: nucleotidyltransferase family protein [Nitrospirota bacterium]|jgi:predicted nucleotidyltransferase
MNREQTISRLPQHGAAIRQHYHVTRLALLGSLARNETQEGSDVDLLVEFDGPATFDRFMDLKFHLEDLLGTRVDLVTMKALRQQLRATVEQEAIRVA